MNVFLDTMVYLHFERVDQIDFCHLLGTDSVTILVPRVTFKELDKHKANHNSAHLRNRARQILTFLESKIRSGEPVREGVHIEFLPSMPQVDLVQLDLNPAWNDDLLIASVVECSQNLQGVDTVLVTHDTGARMTCRNLGVRTFELPDKYRLPPEVDEVEKEKRRLQRELQQLKNALPNITIGFAGSLAQSARFSVQPPEHVDESKVAAQLDQLMKEYPERSLAQERAKSDQSREPFAKRSLEINWFSGAIEAEEFDRYNSDRLRYFEAFERYLRDKMEKDNRDRRSFRFRISISNSGTAPADDVDVKLHFPDGFLLYSEGDFPSDPFEPRPPIAPRNRVELLQSQLGQLEFPLRSMRLPDVGPRSSFQLRKSNSYDVSNHFPRIKHGFVEVFPELMLVFDHYHHAAPFHCTYEVNAANMPNAVSGKLNFVIENTSNR